MRAYPLPVKFHVVDTSTVPFPATSAAVRVLVSGFVDPPTLRL